MRGNPADGTVALSLEGLSEIMEHYSVANVHIFMLLNKIGKWHPETHQDLSAWSQPINALISFSVQMWNE